MRRVGPAGQPHALDANVFGTEIGSRILSVGRAWHTAVLKSHGQTRAYTETANLAPESREALSAIDLHFHAARRDDPVRGAPSRFATDCNESRDRGAKAAEVGSEPRRNAE
jgi:hypothetical protein